jgi:hypothetical protein
MPLESSQDLFRQRRVIVRDRERPGAEAEGSRTRLCSGDRPQLRDWTAIADHDEVFSGLNPI